MIDSFDPEKLAASYWDEKPTPPKAPKLADDDIDVSDLLERMRGGVFKQESGGNYQVKPNARTGATGGFQVLPANIPQWTKNHIGRSLTREQFERDPQAQEAVFTGEMGKYLKAARKKAKTDDDALRMAAAAWYGGEGAMHRYDDPTRFRPNEPSFREYTLGVLKKSGKGFDADALASDVWAEDDFDADALASQVWVSDEQVKPKNPADVGIPRTPSSSPTNPVNAAPVGSADFTAKPVPETDTTVEAQLRSTFSLNSPKAATLVTDPEQMKSIDPMGLEVVQTSKGTLLVNPAKAAALGVTDYEKDLSKLLGYVDEVSDTSEGVVVRTASPDGTELSTAVVTSPESAVKQADIDRQMYPESTKQEVMPVKDAVALRQNGLVTQKYQQWLKDRGLQDDRASRQTFEVEQKAEADAERDRKMYETPTPQQEPRNAQARPQPQQVRAPQGEVSAIADWTGDGRSGALDSAASMLAGQIGVDYDLVRSTIENVQSEKGVKFDEGIAQRGKEGRRSITFALDANTVANLKDAQADRNRKREQSKAEFESGKASLDPSLNAADRDLEEFRLKSLADVNAGLLSQGDADQAYEKLKGDINAWREDRGFLGIWNEEEYATKKAGLERAASVMGGALKSTAEGGKGIEQIADETKVTPESIRGYFDEAYSDIKKQYGSISNYVDRRKEYVKRFEDKPMYFIGKGMETAVGGAMKVPFEIAASTLESIAIGADAIERTLGYEGSDAEKKATYRLGQDLRDLAEGVKIDKDFKGSNAERIGNIGGQVLVQSIAAILSGGATAPALLGAFQGAAQNYRSSGELKDADGNIIATPWQRLGNSLAGGLIAGAGEYVVFKGMMGGGKILAKSELLQNLKATVQRGLVEKGFLLPQAEKAAVSVADGFLARMVEQGGWKGTVGRAGQMAKDKIRVGAGESVQEGTEDPLNDLAAYLSYDPSPERWKKITTIDGKTITNIVGGFFGGVSGATLADISARAETLNETEKSEVLEIVDSLPLPDETIENIKKAVNPFEEAKGDVVDIPTDTSVTDKQGRKYIVVESIDDGKKLRVKDESGIVSVRNSDRLTPINETETKTEQIPSSVVEEQVVSEVAPKSDVPKESPIIDTKEASVDGVKTSEPVPAEEKSDRIAQIDRSVEYKKLLRDEGSLPESTKKAYNDSIAKLETEKAEIQQTEKGFEVVAKSEPTATSSVGRLKEQRDVAKRAAETDTLTGLANRAALDKALPTAEKDADTNVISFDANNFGKINKVVNQEEGDRALVDVANAIKQAAEEYGVKRAFRRGGDEFVVLAPKKVAEQVKTRAEEIYGEKQYGPVTVSVSGTVGDTFQSADAVLQEAKTKRKAVQTEKQDAKFSKHFEKVKDTLNAVEGEQYTSIELKDQAKRAYDLIESDPTTAMRVAYDMEKPPEGIKKGAVGVMLYQSLREAGKFEQAQTVARTTSMGFTEAAQELNTAKLDIGDPMRLEQSIERSRLAKQGKGFNLKEKSALEQGREKVKARAKSAARNVRSEAAGIQSADELLKMLVC